MADQYLSTDPNAGKPVSAAVQAQYLSTQEDSGRKPGELGRVDSNMVGVDHDKLGQALTDAAVRHLPPSLAPSAARIGTFIADSLASTLEIFSSPESVGTGGTAAAARRLPQSVPAKTPTLPRTSYPTHQPGAVVRQIGEKIADAPLAGITKRAIGAVVSKTPTTKTFQDVPLALQMEHLPITRTGTITPYQPPAPQPAVAPVAGRTGTSMSPAPMQKPAPTAPPVTSASVAQVSKEAAKLKLTMSQYLEGMAEYQRMVKQGIPAEQAGEMVIGQLKLIAQQRLPATAAAKASVAGRNASGAWKP